MSQYAAIDALISEMRNRLADWPELAALFARCYANTVDTTVERDADGTTFVVTGDIPAMWLRDSSAQVTHYLPLVARDPDVADLIRGVIRRQAEDILRDPYANAFNRLPTGYGYPGDLPPTDPYVWERKFELDSHCHCLRLCHAYWRETGDMSIFSPTHHRVLETVVEVMRVEQHHEHESSYRFERLGPVPPSDNLPGDRHEGAPVAYTGLVWSGFRPSDDACIYPYLIPANMFAVVALGYLAEMARAAYADETLACRAEQLASEIDRGIQTHGVVEHPEFGPIYAYEVDGFGHSVLMDDANVPSLLAIPYLGYRRTADPVYRATRRFVLSQHNPYYHAGRYAQGIGSPHTPPGYVWPIALAMQGLTAVEPAEQDALVHMLVDTTAGTGYMHESFDPDDPARFTRAWFAWANSLFSEFILAWASRSS